MMRRAGVVFLTIFFAATPGALFGCREPLQFDRVQLADPERGARLFRANCAKSCHPAYAFEQPEVTSYEALAYTVRDYYEGLMGGEDNYSQQDIFDLTRYLNDKHYKFQHKTNDE